MLSLSAEAGTAKAVRGIKSYCVPHYYYSETSPLAAAKKLSKSCNDITYTQVCRGFKSMAAAREALAAAAKISSITTVFCVTGDHASKSDISIFDLLMVVDRKRFKTASAIVFTRKSEAQRTAKKAGTGATIFYTQPVFASNLEKLAATLKQLQKVRCEVRIGVLIPFPAAVCMKIAKEKPDFISESAFIRQLAAAENKGAKAACDATVKIARENLNAAMKAADAANASSKSCCKVTGIHFYGLANRVFGTGKQAVKVTAAELLGKVLGQPKNITLSKEGKYKALWNLKNLQSREGYYTR